MAGIDDITFHLPRFGDEQSTLLDQFERLSFEVHLNQAILGRSLSQPAGARASTSRSPSYYRHEPPLVTQKVTQGRRRRAMGLDKVLSKLLRPIFGKKNKPGSGGDHAKCEVGVQQHPRGPLTWKAPFSRSLRL